MMFGFGNIFSFFSPTILGAFTKSIGMQGAMMVFAAIALIATIISFFVKETGPKAKNKNQKSAE